MRESRRQGRFARALRPLWMGALLACATLLSSCLVDRNEDGQVVVACLGDSNSAPFPYGLWCRDLDEARPNVWFLNYAMNGAKAFSDDPAAVDDGRKQLRDAAAGTQGPPADYAILAFLTNDIGALGSIAPEEAVSRIQDLRALAESLGIATFVATVPPRFRNFSQTGVCEAAAATPVIDATNDLLRSIVQANRLIDFNTGFTCPDHFFTDGVHINPAGQTIRFQRADEVLFPKS